MIGPTLLRRSLKGERRSLPARPVEHFTPEGLPTDCGSHTWAYVGPAWRQGVDATAYRPEDGLRDALEFVGKHVGRPQHEVKRPERPEKAGAVVVPARYRRADCDAPNLFRCLNCTVLTSFACMSKDEDKCAKCEMRYRKAVRYIAREPLKVARPGSVVLLTTTAPGAQRHCNVHRYWADGKSRPSVRCEEGVPHPDGRPHDFCPCGEEGHALTTRDEIAAWNVDGVTRWNRMATDLRRGSSLTGGRADFERMEYFKATEPQKRGALHFHVLIRVPRVLVLDDELRGWLRDLAVSHGFGHEVDVQLIGDGDLDHVKAARYVAKYVTKANRGSAQIALPKRPDRVLVQDEESGDLYTQHHPGCDCSTSKDGMHASHRPVRRPRAWTASRRWGLSLGLVRASQRLYAAGMQAESREMVTASLTRAGLGANVETDT